MVSFPFFYFFVQNKLLTFCEGEAPPRLGQRPNKQSINQQVYTALINKSTEPYDNTNINAPRTFTSPQQQHNDHITKSNTAVSKKSASKIHPRHIYRRGYAARTHSNPHRPLATCDRKPARSRQKAFLSIYINTALSYEYDNCRTPRDATIQNTTTTTTSHRAARFLTTTCTTTTTPGEPAP